MKKKTNTDFLSKKRSLFLSKAFLRHEFMITSIFVCRHFSLCTFFCLNSTDMLSVVGYTYILRHTFLFFFPFHSVLVCFFVHATFFDAAGHLFFEPEKTRMRQRERESERKRERESQISKPIYVKPFLHEAYCQFIFRVVKFLVFFRVSESERAI